MSCRKYGTTWKEVRGRRAGGMRGRDRAREGRGGGEEKRKRVEM